MTALETSGRVDRVDFGAGQPTVFTIGAERGFADALARGLFEEAGGDPVALSEGLVLLPNRRSCRALREAFLRIGDGAPLLLPEFRPVGEVDPDELVVAFAGTGVEADLPLEMPRLRGQLLLADLVRRHAPDGDAMTAGHAVALAGHLGDLIERMATQRLDFDHLGEIVPDRYAEHWQRNLDFLQTVMTAWQEILEREERMGFADWRNRLLKLQAEAWTHNPPSRRIVAAGSTGSIPATADLLAVVSRLERGCVVLPGFDSAMDESDRESARLEEIHPQHGMLALLAHLEAAPEDVREWPISATETITPGNVARRILAREIMRPANTTDSWRRGLELPEAAFDGLTRIDCPGDAEEAGVIALLLRETVESPGQTAALVTTDRTLARRVRAEMRRWGIDLDDGAGVSLAQTPTGAFLGLLTDAAKQKFTPVALLALLKHPMAAAGGDRPTFLRTVRQLEKRVLRGFPVSALAESDTGLDGLTAARAAVEVLEVNNAYIERVRTDCLGLIDTVIAALAPFAAMMARGSAPLADLVRAHIEAAEALAQHDFSHAPLWREHAGEAAVRFAGSLLEAAEDIPAFETGTYPALLQELLARQVVRFPWGRHPRLHIWSPVEARLQRVDKIILGGLNEGTWPRVPLVDVWLNRPMQAELGMPGPERQVGQIAHDFEQAFCAPEVFLTRAEKSAGTPTVPSRWLARMDTVVRAAGTTAPGTGSWLAWQRRLGRAEVFAPVGRPAPRPPVKARPRRLAVTQIEIWLRDPYAIYARHILRLRPLDALEPEADAASRGSIIHEALDKFISGLPRRFPRDALERLLACGKQAFDDARLPPVKYALWWHRFETMAAWFVDQERERWPEIAQTRVEVWGERDLEGEAGSFKVFAKADRIDRMKDGNIAIIDYKTGGVPAMPKMRAGDAPQLPLEAAMIEKNGFEKFENPALDPVGVLHYWHLTGGDPPGKILGLDSAPNKNGENEVAAAVASAWRKVEEMVVAFDRETTPYYAIPDSKIAPAFNHYEHLERLGEWSTEESSPEKSSTGEAS